MTADDEFRPTVTAVVTTYDRPERCKRALRSLREQTYDPLEVVVVEDGTETDVEQWVTAEFPAATYVRHEENQGLPAARNTGLERASGEYVAYLDDDDVWKPQRVERQVTALSDLAPEDRDEVGVVYCAVERRTTAGEVRSVGRPRNDGDLAESIRECGAATLPSTFLFDAGALQEVGGFDESLVSSVDHDIWMSLATAGYRALAVDEPLAVTYVESRERMVTDTTTRLRGVEQFLEKWTPTYREWFGPRAGEVYAQRYYARVVARLAADNLVGGSLGGAWVATRAIFSFSDQHTYNAAVLVRTVVVTALVTVLPIPVLARLRSLKNAVF